MTPNQALQATAATAGLADLSRRGGKTDHRIQEMKPAGHSDPIAANAAATKLFTVGCGRVPVPTALPPMNNFG
jgi:hypothetical protein